MSRRNTKTKNTTDCYVKITKLNLNNLNIYDIKKKSEKMTKTRRSVAVVAPVEETISTTRSKRTPKPNRRYLDNADKIESRENSQERRGNNKKNIQSDDEVIAVKKSVSKISTAPKTEPIKKSVSRVVLSKERELRSSTPVRSLRNNDLTSKRKIDTELDEKKPPAKKMKDNSIHEEPVRRLTRQTKIETPVVIKSTTITKKLNVSKNEIPTKISKEIIPKKIVEPIKTTKPIKKTAEPEEDKLNVSTDIDFEDEVPSFKIVNVNDIIMQKKGDDLKPTKNDDKKIQLRSKPKKTDTYYELSENEDFDDDDSYDDGDFENDKHTTTDDSDFDVPLRKTVKRNNSNSSNSRRKAQHTKILSDDVKTAALNAKNKIPDYASTKLNLRNRLNESLGNIKLKAAEQPSTSTPKPKPPPKILNSTLLNKSPTKFTPIISRVVAKESPATKQKNILTPNKLTNNNVRTYKNSHKLPIKTKASGTIVSKNITCIEKWFVMKHTEDLSKIITAKHHSLISLTQLGNEMKNLKLPSDNWSYKILLEKKPNKENENKTTKVYTGEVQDSTIDESDKHNYHPINILFKRKNSDAESKIQSDRTVVFKASTYSITMDGINVKLIGAPVIIYNIQEIQTLLQIIDDVSLINSYVEKIYNYQ